MGCADHHVPAVRTLPAGRSAAQVRLKSRCTARSPLENPQQEYTRRLVAEREHALTPLADGHASSGQPLLSMQKISTGYNGQRVVHDVSLQLPRGKTLAIIGESGSGKSTLMNLIGGLDSDFEGEIIYQGKNLRDYTKQELDRFHKKSIGFIT